MKAEKILIVGYGRFGKLMADLLKSDFSVAILEKKKNIRLGRGLRRAFLSEIGEYPVVLLALPIHRLGGFLRREAKRIQEGAFVADVSALKVEPMRWMKRHLPTSVSYAGLHPLFGPDSARRGLSGLSVVVCRGRSTVSCHRRLKTFLKKLSLKVVETDPVTHDKTISSTLFLTQWFGNILPAGIWNNRPLFENPTAAYLSTISRRAQSDQSHILIDLCRFSKYSAEMHARLTRRSLKMFRKVKSLPGRGRD